MSPLYPPPGPQSIGRVLDTAFRIFKASAVRCLVLGPLAIISGQAPNIYHIAMGRPTEATFGGNDPVWWVLYAIGALASITFTAALIKHQHDIVAGIATRATDQLKKAIRMLPALVGLVVLVLLVVGVLPGALALLTLYTGLDMPNVWRIAMIVVAAISIYLLVGQSLTWCALLIDRLPALGAVRYSLSLVRGNWWRTLLILVITMIVMFVFYFVIIAVLAPLVGAMEVALVAAVTEVLATALSALVAPYFSGTLLAIYGDLKARREGADLERRIAAVARS